MTKLVTLSAYLFCLILVCLSVFQIALIAGAPLGHFAWGGQNEVLPTAYRIGSVTSLIIYVIFAIIVLQKAKILMVFKNQKVVNIGIWVIFGYSCLGIIANLATRSSSERMVMAPVVTILAILSFIIARSKN